MREPLPYNKKAPPAGRFSRCCRHDAAGGVVDVPSLEPTTDNSSQDGLFDAVVSVNAYGRDVSYEIPEHDYRRGAGSRRTTGPEDAVAPAWWWAEAERVVMDVVTAGGTICSDDLHEAFPEEPSASGAAFGGLFTRLANEGRIVEVGMVKSRRPEARRRRIIVWGRPS